MKWRPNWSTVTIALAVIAALAIASPALGVSKGIKRAIKKEVSRQIHKAKGPAGKDGVSGYQEVSTSSTYDSTSPKTAPNAQCPAGKKLLGGGVTITSDSNSSPVAVVISGPNTAGGTYWLGKGIETTPTSDSWNVQVSAYCADL